MPLRLPVALATFCQLVLIATSLANRWQHMEVSHRTMAFQ
jgi:hypothetical protein